MKIPIYELINYILHSCQTSNDVELGIILVSFNINYYLHEFLQITLLTYLFIGLYIHHLKGMTEIKYAKDFLSIILPK